MIPTTNRIYLAALCLARAGLRIDSDKTYLLESRLGPVARREGFPSIEALIEKLRDGGDERLAWATVEAMLLPEAEFFRDRRMFETLSGEVLPAMARAAGGRPLRIWSAACGTGQEIYSLAMLLADAAGLGDRVELFASDLSERALEKAQAAAFSQFEVQRGLPARLLVRCFEKEGEAFVLSPRLRQMVRWRRVNLLDDVSALGRFDVILCRNLLPQLAPEAKDRVLQSLSGALLPGGRLVLGPGEAAGRGLTAIDPAIGLHAAATGDDVRSAA
ncbi:protein-glutamate O-methyltransferase CheR [Phenylobacterium sp.]|uniref:CheR family methyltransferase n=1 Tax=Phenylobacterium sp. TaxID=1871053 RepID=UPI0025D97984|nr:protein-glutamate O-methyltransferase CheR [Phenylobacterium sp.]